MQDIDFDEIDRAVNSTMGPETASTEVSSEPSRSEERPTSSPAARRSSGRFMDVVHPSSDMRSRGGEERSVARPPVSTPAAPAEPEQPAGSSDWPDPLDFHGFKSDEEPATESADEPEENSPSEPAQPLESPFLTDAKVEKRPLGAFSTTSEPTEKAPMEEETPLLEAPDEPRLEAGDEQSEAEEVPEQEPAPVEQEPEQPPAPVVEEPSSLPPSITQQYKEHPNTEEQPTGAIYDTEAYHQALTHAPKKHSGILVVIWIIALILVGGGLGALAYFFVLPLL